MSPRPGRGTLTERSFPRGGVDLETNLRGFSRVRPGLAVAGNVSPRDCRFREWRPSSTGRNSPTPYVVSGLGRTLSESTEWLLGATPSLSPTAAPGYPAADRFCTACHCGGLRGADASRSGGGGCGVEGAGRRVGALRQSSRRSKRRTPAIERQLRRCRVRLHHCSRPSGTWVPSRPSTPPWRVRWNDSPLWSKPGRWAAGWPTDATPKGPGALPQGVVGPRGTRRHVRPPSHAPRRTRIAAFDRARLRRTSQRPGRGHAGALAGPRLAHVHDGRPAGPALPGATISTAGLDIAAEKGQPVYATAEGTVKERGYQNSYGNLIVLDHGFGLETRYGHLSRFDVQSRATR